MKCLNDYEVHYTTTSTTLLKQLKITRRAPAGQNGPALSQNCEYVLLEVLIGRKYLYIKTFYLQLSTLRQQNIHTMCEYCIVNQ